MARVLQFHPASVRGYRVPGYPNTHHDADRVSKEARLRSQSEEAYVAGALAFHWPDGKPAFTVGPHAPEPLAAIEAPPVAEPPAEAPKPRKA